MFYILYCSFPFSIALSLFLSQLQVFPNTHFLLSLSLSLSLNLLSILITYFLSQPLVHLIYFFYYRRVITRLRDFCRDQAGDMLSHYSRGVCDVQSMYSDIGDCTRVLVLGGNSDHVAHP